MVVAHATDSSWADDVLFQGRQMNSLTVALPTLRAEGHIVAFLEVIPVWRSHLHCGRFSKLFLRRIFQHPFAEYRG
jgi:hypothetical protein